MLVAIAHDLPPAIRGRMKLWFIEPRPNVFVSGITDSLALHVVDYLLRHCPADSGLLLFRACTQAPGFQMYHLGQDAKPWVNLSGLQLVVETLLSEKPQGVV